MPAFTGINREQTKILKIIQQTLSSFFILFLFLPFPLFCQELYKGIDSTGTTRYSDKPFPGAKAFTPEPISIAPEAIKPTLAENSIDKKKVVPSYQISISSPENNQIFSHETQFIPVTLILTPETPNTTIRLLLNGEVLPQSDSKQLILPPLARGSYQLQAELLDPNQLDKPLATSKTITFYQQRAFVKQ